MIIYPSDRLKKLPIINTILDICNGYNNLYPVTTELPGIEDISGGNFSSVYNLIKSSNLMGIDDADISFIALICNAHKGTRKAVDILLTAMEISIIEFNLTDYLQIGLSNVSATDINLFTYYLKQFLLEHLWIPSGKVSVYVQSVKISIVNSDKDVVGVTSENGYTKSGILGNSEVMISGS